MSKELTFHVLKGGHTFGKWYGDPIPAKQREVCQVNEEPMLPVILDDPNPDKKKPVTDENEDILMPPTL